jgi:hypothetical protein
MAVTKAYKELTKFRKGQIAYIDLGFGDFCRIGYYWGRGDRIGEGKFIFVHKQKDAYRDLVSWMSFSSLESVHTKPIEKMKRMYNHDPRRIKDFNFYIREMLYEKI